MNVELLEKIAVEVSNRPKQFDMSAWHAREGCETTHCIGGWAQVLSGLPEEAALAETQAQEVLGITSYQAERLFYHDEWPLEFLPNDIDELPTASQAAARIRHFIATNGKE